MMLITTTMMMMMKLVLMTMMMMMMAMMVYAFEHSVHGPAVAPVALQRLLRIRNLAQKHPQGVMMVIAGLSITAAAAARPKHNSSSRRSSSSSRRRRRRRTLLLMMMMMMMMTVMVTVIATHGALGDAPVLGTGDVEGRVGGQEVQRHPKRERRQLPKGGRKEASEQTPSFRTGKKEQQALGGS
jgi:predicted nucleic acid-binding Zn ribbon protein